MISAVMGRQLSVPMFWVKSLYISKKQFVEKNKTSLVHVRLLSGIGRRSSAIFEHKNVHSMHL